ASSQVWTEIQQLRLRDGRLSSAASDIPRIIKKGKSDNSNRVYDAYFKKFQHWCSSLSVSSMPASVSTVAVYLSSLVQKSVSESVLSTNFYSIKWHHDISLCANPCDSKILHLLMEGGKRILSKPINKKEPITPEILKKIVEKYGQDANKNNLSHVRICSMFLLGFSGFLRFSELSKLKVKNISFHELHMSVHIEGSKTDVYRRGNNVLIARTSKDTCPVYWLKLYLDLAGISKRPEDFIFRSIRYFKSSDSYKLCSCNRPISYTRARELLRDALASVGLDTKCFGLHSLRSGGATSAAENNVSDRLLKLHGRWKSDLSRDNYIKDSTSNQLSVTKKLNI
ncbi:hypothetical protein FSP39_011926, partial [Pinctada imbricata]